MRGSPPNAPRRVGVALLGGAIHHSGGEPGVLHNRKCRLSQSIIGRDVVAASVNDGLVRSPTAL